MYFVYIMTNRSRTLYTGVTNNLVRRVRQHKTGIGSGFTAKYKLDRLVYFERFEYIQNAIEREKTIKGWLRIKKIALIVSINPSWKDLSAEWYERHQYEPQAGQEIQLPPRPNQSPSAPQKSRPIPNLSS
jgi:putative endonuclease